MLEGVRILIDRMETCPEEFVYDIRTKAHVQKTPKFFYITEAINAMLEGGVKYNMFSHLTAEEKTALIVAFRKMMRQAFTAQVIAQAFEDKAEEEAQVAMNTIAKAPRAPVSYLGSHGTSITDETLINRHLEEKIREHARTEAKRVEVPLWKL